MSDEHVMSQALRYQLKQKLPLLCVPIIGLGDVITFQGTSVEKLELAFKDSVDEYLDFCKELGRTPEKPFSGKLILRLPILPASFIDKKV